MRFSTREPVSRVRNDSANPRGAPGCSQTSRCSSISLRITGTLDRKAALELLAEKGIKMEPGLLDAGSGSGKAGSNEEEKKKEEEGDFKF